MNYRQLSSTVLPMRLKEAQSVADALDALFADLPERLSIEQLTAVLGLADTTITYRWLRDGTIPAMKLGKRWLILRDDVKEHLRASYNTVPPSVATSPHKPK